MKASFQKTYRQMALGCTARLSLPIGLLDNASAFSPAQAMIDLDAAKSMYGFARGIEVTGETMCLDLIDRLEFCERHTYLESEHTLKHFRDVLWDSHFLGSTVGEPDDSGGDAGLLARADERWREWVRSQEQLEVSSEFRKKLDEIVEAAGRELLTE